MKRPSIKKFQKHILEWYRENGRHQLPWRATRDPYRVMVSEIMLQQTQVDRVIEKYKEFLKAFPTAPKLARASVSDLLKVWKGLGYTRRALNLQKAARMIGEDFCGEFPQGVDFIQKLPGIGHYTARAIATFAFGQAHTFIETNIRRIFIHFFFSDSAGVSDEEILPLVQKALWRQDPYVWYSALMDYGALAMKDIPNPNKKSKHYARQSRFEGSRRYARAKILDYLLAHRNATTKALERFCVTDTYLKPYQSQLIDILGMLEVEGFIMKKDQKWSLKK